MKDVVTLLGTVIQHLERQTKPPPPKIATQHELYPELRPIPWRAERAWHPLRRSARAAHAVLVARALWQEDHAMMPTPPPIWGYITQGHHWFQQHQLEAWGGLAALFAAGLMVKTRKRWGRQDLTSHGSARWATVRDVRQAGLSRAHGVVLGVMDGDIWMDDRETHDLLLAPTGSGKDTFHLFPTLQWGWTQSTLNLDCQNGEMYDATHAVRAQYGRVEAFAPYRSPLACINVLDAIRLGQARRIPRCPPYWAESYRAREDPAGVVLRACTFASWPRSRLPPRVSMSATRPRTRRPQRSGTS